MIRPFRSTVLAVTVVVILAPVPGHAVPGGAAPAAPAGPALRLERRVGPPTTSTMAGGRGFGASETVDLTFDGDALGSATTDSSGAFQTRIKIPTLARPGRHQVSGTGETSGLTAQAQFIVSTDWSMFHDGPARTGFNPYENVLGPSNVAGLRVVWRFTPGVGGFVTSPAVVNGVVYVAGNYLDAVDAKTGADLWRVDFAGYSSESAPAVAYGMVYVGVGPDLWALDTATGEKVWTFPTGNAVDAPPAVANGVVYEATLDGHLYALDALTGAVQWDLHTGAYERSIPAVANGVVYWGSGNGTLYALDAATGAQLWTAPVPIAGLVGPAVVDEVVYVGAADGRILALEAATGATRWSFATHGGILGSPAVANGVVYVPAGIEGSATTGMYALHAASGTKVWSRFVFHFHFCSSPVVANGVLYVASPKGGMAALDAATGTVLWRHRAGAAVYSSVAIANGRVYLASERGATYAFGL